MSKPYAAIREFVRLLNQISGLPLGTYESTSGSETVALKILMEGGLIRYGDHLGKSFSNLQITPAGASRLVEWEAFLHNNSPRGKFINWAYQFSWVLVGAVVSNGDRVFSYFAQIWGN